MVGLWVNIYQLGEFKCMTEKKIHKLDPSNNEKGLILEVDPEYPNELHDIHNDYPSLLKK